MTKAGGKILAGARDALAIVRGEKTAGYNVRVPHEIDTRRMREKLNLTQEAFAARFGIPVATLRDWEHGRRMPDAATRVLLVTIDTHPDVVASAAVSVAQPVNVSTPAIKVRKGRSVKAPSHTTAKAATKKMATAASGKRAGALKRTQKHG